MLRRIYDATWCRGFALLAPLAVGLLAAAQAGAATIVTDRACYGEGEPVTLVGAGFTPNGEVGLLSDGAPVGSIVASGTGLIAARGPAPVIDPSRQRRFSLVATDVTDPTITATVLPLATLLDVRISPKHGKPTRKRRISARGFTHGRALYLHVRRHGYRRNVKLGRLKPPCGTAVVRRRLFKRQPKRGAYKLQFDAKRRYSSWTLPRVTFTDVVSGILVPLGAAGALPDRERWAPLP
jgi:hypothetical protein